MGIISDILEANKERAGAFFSSRPRTSRPRPASPVRLTVECPLCPLWFLNETALQSHIVSAHRSIQAYIKINTRVVHETIFVEEPITGMEVVCFGENQNRVELLLPGGLSRSRILPSNRVTRIDDLIPADFSGVLDIKLHYGKAKRWTKVYCRRMPDLDIQPLDTAVQSLQRAFLDCDEFDVEDFQKSLDRIRHDNSKQLQFRYMAGFFEYFLGSDLERRNPSKASTHFECAFGYLRPFATDMAHTVRAILGLKMNWFELLEDCGISSPFFPAKEFFLGKERRATSARKPHSERVAAQGIWIDPFSECYLKALSRFNSRNLDDLNRFINELERNPLVNDRNNENKLWLLKARVSKAMGEPAKAIQAYKNLLSDPVFGPEAEKNL